MNPPETNPNSTSRLQFETEEEILVSASEFLAQSRLDSQIELESQLTPEEAIQADREQTAPPASIAGRLSRSIQRESQSNDTKSWWKRWFSANS